LSETVKVLFASGSEDLIPTAIEHLRNIFPEIPLVVVSEFAPPHQDIAWIPFPVSRGFRENLALFRWHFRGRRIRISAVILQPRMPYWQMRWIAFFLAPWNFLAFNESFGHFMLRPASAGTILRHILWRTRNFLVWHFSPGGTAYTFFWRLAHPGAFGRPLLNLFAKAAGVKVGLLKSVLPHRSLAMVGFEPRLQGISVVIPSRNGRDLLRAMLPEVVRQVEQIGGEVIVIDNGSDDGTADFLGSQYPGVVLESAPPALSFARASNAGIRMARYAQVCLLNNDMQVEPEFFAALSAAFHAVPNLFSGTAQIFFPEGARREETGKAVMTVPSERKPIDFPVRCELPFAGEDLSYVLYGSGGCSLFDARKLQQLGGFDEIYAPAYVEDLDLGFRGWQQGWPSVFVARARVLHQHRATTSRYYTPEFLERILELNYLRFLVRAVANPRVFRRLWREAINRLNLLGGQTNPKPAAQWALAQAWRAPFWVTRIPESALPDDYILAIASGAVTVIPGCTPRHRPVILIATPYLPFPMAHGGAVRMYNLMRRAAQHYDQVLVSFAPDSREAPAELLEICSEVVLVTRPGTHLLPSTSRPDIVEEFDSPAFHAALRQTVRKWKPALAQLEFTQMAQYALDCPPAKTVLVEHDVTLDLYQQLLAQGDDWELRRQLARWIRFETEAWRKVDRVVTMSEKDRALVSGRAQAACHVVCLPNGVDLDRFRPSDVQPDARRLLFIGSFAHLPNVLAVDFFLREAWAQLKAQGATLHIIAGARHQYYLDRYHDRVQPDLAQRGIEIQDFVADVRPAYQRATVVVAPLVASAGTNIKIMEAMAMGKAVVSTPAGINGLDLNPGTDVIVANTGTEMARAILNLLENPTRRETLERAARLTVERTFGWDVIAARQQQLYDELT
jgi:GT2 family glycosyltransferase